MKNNNEKQYVSPSFETVELKVDSPILAESNPTGPVEGGKEDPNFPSVG